MTIPPFRENLAAPETFADDGAFVSVQNGLATITLTRLIHDNSPDGDGQPVRAVVGRLTMPAAGMLAMANGVVAYLAPPAPAPEPTSQPETIQ
ncbi:MULTISPECIES: hypothetical protein [unclassified Acidiphilium]|uniref:hypothetical protein n=1 Tax=unclassified Acidiphilium TaxID=2617493 RepID=UPI000BD3D6EC|nr:MULTISPECIES: hypothetical protein [unclassified Acidiphilium]OYV54525.1 MAG: hypothetical protein B7Z76_14210 [Acidiphilium sp. 20-67-58]HQT62526.1 hypothetical protein [Acidiphilium sp.]